jgi:drug/metabolite transporter (DMT)-like permease
VPDWRAVAVFLGLLASVAYGVADFVGGVVSRRNHVFTVLLWGQFIGIAWVLTALPFLAGGPPTARGLLFGAGAGIGGTFGAAALFRGLAHGRMSVVAPVTAVLAASLPVLFGLLTGERPTPLALLGVAVALGAIALVSTVPEPGQGHGRGAALRARLVAEGLPEGVAAGLCFALYFVLISLAPDDSGLWPILGVRSSSVAIAGAIVAGTGVHPRPVPGTTVAVLFGGFVGSAADYVFLLASRLGLLSVVAVLTSLYPVTTVVLARTVLKERIGRVQLAGLVLAGTGVVLITLG